jgi:hypothetical protein
MVEEEKHFFNKLDIYSIFISKKIRKRKAYYLSFWTGTNDMNKKSMQRMGLMRKAFKSHRAVKRLRFFLKLNSKMKPR